MQSHSFYAHTSPPVLAQLQKGIDSSRILSRATDRVGFSSDASFYRLIPEVVVQPKTEQEIQHLFTIANTFERHLVFRAAGTSLSGQAITDGILVDIARYWRHYEILDEGAAIRLQPGVIGAHANLYLQSHGRKIGPDPASINTCMLGGIVANNASGMCCGVKQNSYHTLQDIRFILPNGHVYDSSDTDASATFQYQDSALYKTLADLRDRIRSDNGLTEKIREKYGRKNTTGYSLNAFLDHSDPFKIFCQLLVGSEGTLAYISDVTLRTLPDLPEKSTAVIAFPTLEKTVSAVWPLQRFGAEAVELMDRASLHSVENQKGIPEQLEQTGEEAAALLVEFQAQTASELLTQVNEAEQWLQNQSPEFSTGFSRDPDFQARLWKIRKGLYPSVGAVRKSGTSVIIEDIAFPLEHLAEATGKVRRILDAHNYPESIIFGHAKDGNIHFVIAQDFDDEGLKQYQHLIEDIVRLVVEEYGGSLKAEHGTGRNMAPFVETEWGADLYHIMWELKQAVDPNNILNPGVIVNENPHVYLENIKPMPSVETIIDKCVECGFCEPVCPSRDLTTTPRRRIVLWREITRLAAGDANEKAMAEHLKTDYEYDAVATCAADGMCGTACPVDIDTGKMMKYLRSLDKSSLQLKLADATVDHFTTVAHGLRVGLTAAAQIQATIGSKPWNTAFDHLHSLTKGSLPAWNSYFPTGAPKSTAPVPSMEEAPEVVYFPSCLSRSMGEIPGESAEMSVSAAVCAVLERAGIPYTFPANYEGLCCGTPWSSKGYTEAYKRMAERMTSSLWVSSDHGKIPVVIDTSPCSYSIMHYDEILTGEALERWKSLQFYDITEYLFTHVMNRLTLQKKPGTVICHPTCSTMKMEQTQLLQSIASQCAEKAEVPEHHGCCGFAGDRGLLHPELTASATQAEAASVEKIANVSGYYSTSRTCEVGMSSATEHPYQSIIHLVETASRPDNTS